MRARDQGRALLATLRRAMIEVERPARHALVCLLADGHLLLEDVPGVGKTTLARIIARAIGGHDPRIQCTADLAPSRHSGSRSAPTIRRCGPTPSIPGPMFANAVVLDEMNRATPKLQAALFEAMAERFVSLAKKRYPLPRPFFVVATMNPHKREEETYRLALGQRDRFAIRPRLGYPTERGEFELLERFAAYDALADVDLIVAPGDIVKVQRGAQASTSRATPRVPRPLVRMTRELGGRQLGARPAPLSRCSAAPRPSPCLGQTAVHPDHVQGAVRAVPRPPHAVPPAPTRHHCARSVGGGARVRAATSTRQWTSCSA